MNAFLKGICSIFDFTSKTPSYEEITGFKDDSEAIASDWKEIGDDFNKVINNLEQKGYKVDSVKDLSKYLNSLKLTGKI